MAKEQFVRKLQRMSSHSYSVTVPKELIEELGWRERQKLVFKKSGKKLILEDWRR
jgi:bifunctional DNA-binding transcriptional regulator/antitoxin component of YhaV-PrlF toxin-antitoxin module